MGIVNHSSGPWYRDVLFVRANDGSYIADIKLDPLDPIVEANIRLILAAPDLLEALKECAERLQIHMKHTEDLVAHMKACKVIASIEGKQE